MPTVGSPGTGIPAGGEADGTDEVADLFWALGQQIKVGDTRSTNSRQPDELRWFKSTRSGGDGGECVGIAVDAAIHVRDSTRSAAALASRSRGARGPGSSRV
ncbi:DUF397 domain-containing protein [Streptomyces sp. NPDC052020]|uniref:DUF397 domain-containing protein n=1 Tax=Streptomyces sp. NPDC052020 TaxID=3155677 RepID=UPI003448401E